MGALHRLSLFNQGEKKGLGLLGWAIIIIIIILIISLILCNQFGIPAFWCPEPEKLVVSGPDKIPAGGSETFTLTVTLTGKAIKRTYKVAIEEADTVYDDVLYDEETLSVTIVNSNTGGITFTLSCSDATEGADDVYGEDRQHISKDEKVHHIHAEYDRPFWDLTSDNHEVSCAAVEED